MPRTLFIFPTFRFSDFYEKTLKRATALTRAPFQIPNNDTFAPLSSQFVFSHKHRISILLNYNAVLTITTSANFLSIRCPIARHNFARLAFGTQSSSDFQWHGNC